MPVPPPGRSVVRCASDNRAVTASREPPADQPLAGTPYRFVRSLRQGAMGEVVVAEHIALGRLVALKSLHADIASDPTFIERLRLEAQAAARIASPHIVSVLDIGVTAKGRPYLVMELLSGNTLSDELRARGRFEPEEAIDVALQLLHGLDATHTLGLVHRDLKPANLFLCDRDTRGQRHLKILDFGIAKVLRGAAASAPGPIALPTEQGVTLGTPRYMAPEQATGRPVDARTDLYAAGLILYELLAGRGPFADIRQLGPLLEAQVGDLPPPPSSFAPVSPALEAVVMRAIEKRPSDRFRSADQFARALRAAAPTPSRPPPRRSSQPEPFPALSALEPARRSHAPASALEPKRRSLWFEAAAALGISTLLTILFLLGLLSHLHR